MNAKKLTTLRDLLVVLSKVEDNSYERKGKIIESFSFKDNLETLKETELTIEEINELLEEVANIDLVIANDLLGILGIDFFVENVNSSNNVAQIAKLIDQIDIISLEIMKEVHNKLDDGKLVEKINNSDDLLGISYLLEIAAEISKERGVKILEKISDKKILSLVKGKSAGEKLTLLSRVDMISEERLEKIMEKIDETFIQELLMSNTVYDYYTTLWIFESLSKKLAEKALEKIPLQKIVELAEKKMDIESIAGVIEVMAKISLEKAFEVLDALEPLIIKTAREAVESGDITDVLHVLVYVSKEKAKELLDKITIKGIYTSILQGEYTNTLPSIAWVLEIVHLISPADAKKLMKLITIEDLKERLEKNQNRPYYCFAAIHSINKNSAKDAEYLVRDLQVDSLKSMLLTSNDISWFLKLIRKVSPKKAKEIVIDNENILKAFLQKNVIETKAIFQEVTEIFEDKGLEFIESISKVALRTKICEEIEKALRFEKTFEEEGEVEKIVAEFKELAELIKLISEEKELEIKALIVDIISDLHEEEKISKDRPKDMKWI
jgi:hypothetical protein